MTQLGGLAVALLAASAADHPGPEIRETTTFYDVAGQTAGELRDAMDRARPLGAEGTRVDATAAWKVHYTYQTVAGADGCRLSKLKVTADISRTLPRWVDKPATASPLTDRWEKFVAALTSNLSGVQEIGRRAAASLHESIWKLPKQAQCERLVDAIGATADAVIQQHLAENEQYNKALREDPARAARFP